jgi:hypothetical protein
MKVILVIGLFFVGVVVAMQGFVGKELSDGRYFGRMIDPELHGMEHPPERHRLRLFLIGVGLMVLAVVLLALFV